MTDKQPEALRLADYEEAQALKAGASGSLLAYELRRLHALNADLLEALKAIPEFIPVTSAKDGGAAKYSANVAAADLVRAAIAKAEAA